MEILSNSKIRNDERNGYSEKYHEGGRLENIIEIIF